MTGFEDALGQLKFAFDLFRSAMGATRDARDLLPEGEKKDVVTQTLEEAAKAAQIAEATVAEALGYELCKCDFPPTPMFRIGYRMPHGENSELQYIYECPKCRQNTAGAWMFTREIGENNS